MPAATLPLVTLSPVEPSVAEPQVTQPVDEAAFEIEVAAEAYALFEARGCEHGHDVEDWLAAEVIVRMRR